MYACICHAVPVAEVKAAIACGADTEEAVGATTGAGTGCGTCLDRICELLKLAQPAEPLETVA